MSAVAASPSFKGNATFLGGIFGRQSDPAADDTMLNYFISTLDVRVRAITPQVSADPARKAILDEVAGKIGNVRKIADPDDGDAAWNEAYRLERMLALIEPAENLVEETRRRVDEALDENVPAAPRLQTRLDEALKRALDFSKTPPVTTPQTESILRPLLLDILEETHWSYQKKFCMRPIQRSARNRIIFAELVIFLFIVVPYLSLYFYVWRTHKNPSLGAWSWLPLYSVLTAGLFGAFFSRLQSLQTDWNTMSLGQIRDARDWGSIMLRGAVGMGGALIVYFFLQSGMVGGDLFPKFDHIAISDITYDAKSMVKSDDITPISTPIRLIQPNLSLALLIVWSFIAGFSERLVPGILAATETSIGNAAAGQRK
jgi:hypothetical protein